MSYDLKISGMSCAGCAVRLEKVLNKNGVSSRVDFGSETAQIQDTELGRAQVQSLIEEAGFGVITAQEGKPLPLSLGKAETLGLICGVVVSVVDMGGMLASRMNPLGIATSAILATICQFTIGLPYLRRALVSIRHLAPGMDLLVSLGTFSAWVLSMAVWFHWMPGHHVWFEASASVLVLIRIGKLMEHNARQATSKAMQELSSELPQVARKITDQGIVEVAAMDLRPDDEIYILQHENVPVDAVITEGEACLNEALFTGESMPVDRVAGQTVLAGSLNAGAGFKARVIHRRGNCRLDAMLRSVQNAQLTRAPVQDLTDWVAGWFVPLVLIIALMALGYALFLDLELETALVRMITVLVVSCPCALGLATPTAITAGIGRAAAIGVLVREARSLQKAENIRYFCFDKTGTLTKGQAAVSRVFYAPGLNKESVLSLAAALEQAATHPLGRAIVAAAPTTLLVATEVSVSAGQGIRGIVANSLVQVGSPKYCGLSQFPIWAAPLEDTESVVAVLQNQKLVGLIYLADPVREQSVSAVKQLLALGIRPVLLSGDRQAVVLAVARTCQIDMSYGELQPEDKLKIVKDLQKQGAVAMLGDGINDALALTQADFSVAMGEGSAVARESADLTLGKSDLHVVGRAILLSRQTMSTIRQNLWFAFSYNLIAIPLAFLGKLHPGVAGGLMALSSILVVSNSVRLSRWEFSNAVSTTDQN